MAQKLVQSQQLTQTQTLTPQQLQVVRLLELPVTELEERVQNELLENAALEENSDNEAAETSTQEETTTGGDEEYAGTAPETADALGDYLTSDDVPDYLLARADAEREEREIPFGSSTSFYERLRDQISEHDLTEREAELNTSSARSTTTACYARTPRRWPTNWPSTTASTPHPKNSTASSACSRRSTPAASAHAHSASASTSN